MIRVSQLWIYPFKSCKGTPVTSIDFDGGGICGDRRLMAVDKNGQFITARRHPELLKISCIRNAKGWLLKHAETNKSCQVNDELLCHSIEGVLWKDNINALDAGDDAAEWLSRVLKIEVRVAVWKAQSRYSTKYQMETTFADASPMLVATESSLRQTCQWAGIDNDIRRFRPNIVLDGVRAFAEDSWQSFSIGDNVFEVLDTCTRCILTARNPDTGDMHPDKQPMKALSMKHVNGKGLPVFGINVRLVDCSYKRSVSVGDCVSLLR